MKRKVAKTKAPKLDKKLGRALSGKVGTATKPTGMPRMRVGAVRAKAGK